MHERGSSGRNHSLGTGNVFNSLKNALGSHDCKIHASGYAFLNLVEFLVVPNLETVDCTLSLGEAYRDIEFPIDASARVSLTPIETK